MKKDKNRCCVAAEQIKMMREFKRYCRQMIFLGALVFLGGNFAAAFSWPENSYGELVSLEFPLLYTFETADDGGQLEANGSPGGVLLHVQSRYRFGIGLDYYKVTLAETDRSPENNLNMKLLNLTYLIPLGDFEIMAGLGIGESEIDGPNEDQFEKGQPVQILGRLGLWATPRVMLQIGGRYIWNQINYKETDLALEAGGYLFSAGIGVVY